MRFHVPALPHVDTTRAFLVVLALTLTACATPVASTAPTDPGIKGTHYVVTVTEPSVIRFEGSYAASVIWTEDHQGEWVIYQLPKRSGRCNPARKLCRVP